jgi:hypothetical protein
MAYNTSKHTLPASNAQNFQLNSPHATGTKNTNGNVHNTIALLASVKNAMDGRLALLKKFQPACKNTEININKNAVILIACSPFSYRVYNITHPGSFYHIQLPGRFRIFMLFST